MMHRTRYLDLLVLLCSVAPAELVRVATSFGIGEVNRRRLARISRIGVPMSYVVVAGLAAGVVLLAPGRQPTLVRWNLRYRYLAIGPLVGVLAFGSEIFVGAVPMLRGGARTLRLRANVGGEQVDWWFAGSIATVAAVEEFLYRGLWLGILRGVFGQPTAIAVAIAAIGYAAGHLYFGPMTVAQKFVSGLLFGALAGMPGGLLAAIAAHVTENLMVFWLGYRRRDGG